MRLKSLYSDQGKARYESNRAKTCDTLCDLCGRPLNNRDTWVVEDPETGELVPTNEAYNENSAHTVFLGPECAKRKELKGYIHRLVSLEGNS